MCLFASSVMLQEADVEKLQARDYSNLKVVEHRIFQLLDFLHPKVLSYVQFSSSLGELMKFKT